jgi:hypothetical protein
MHGPGFISIWFFIGVLLTVYGVVIAATGIYELASPPADLPVLYNLHASVWWGAVLLILGIIYFVRFFPKRR